MKKETLSTVGVIFNAMGAIAQINSVLTKNFEEMVSSYNAK